MSYGAVPMPMTEDPEKPEDTPSTEPIEPPDAGDAAAGNGDGGLLI